MLLTTLKMTDTENKNIRSNEKIAFILIAILLAILIVTGIPLLVCGIDQRSEGLKTAGIILLSVSGISLIMSVCAMTINN